MKTIEFNLEYYNAHKNEVHLETRKGLAAKLIATNFTAQHYPYLFLVNLPDNTVDVVYTTEEGMMFEDKTSDNFDIVMREYTYTLTATKSERILDGKKLNSIATCENLTHEKVKELADQFKNNGFSIKIERV